jgi:hypothetical protein
MKRVLLPILILAAGSTVYCALRNSTVVARQELATQAGAWQMQTQQLAQLDFAKQQMIERITETRHLLATQPPLSPLLELEGKILSGASLTNLTVTESEQLLAELGFNWNTTGDYLIVSKKSLAGIYFDAMRGEELTTAARGVLAITPAEQAAIEAVTRQMGDTRAAWALAHAQRIEPAGNVLAQYTLPTDASFSQSQLAIFTSGIFSALGDQRGEWLQDHAVGWMQDVGLRTSPDLSKIPAEILATMPPDTSQIEPTTLTVERYQSGGEWRMNFSLRQGANTMTTSVNPWQSFPEAFRPLFPNGWPDLAAREGFELPKDFGDQKPAQP